MIHSFTPSGVEHSPPCMITIAFIAVIYSFAPSNLFDSHRTDFVFAGARYGVSGIVGQ